MDIPYFIGSHLRKSIGIDIQNFGNPAGHGWRKPALSPFVITNHIPTNAKFLSKLSLSIPCLEPGTCQKVSNSI